MSQAAHGGQRNTQHVGSKWASGFVPLAHSFVSRNLFTMLPNRRLARRLKRHTTDVPEVSRPIAPRDTVRAVTHEPMPTAGRVYNQAWADDTVTFECGYCGIPWPVRDSRIVPVGHLIELCATCRLGRTRCECEGTEFGTKGASDTTIWIPMTRKTQVCGMCAGVYDGMVIRPAQFPHAPYLPSSGATVKQPKLSTVSRSVREFYGDVWPAQGLQNPCHGETKADPKPEKLSGASGIAKLSDTWKELMAAPWGDNTPEGRNRKAQALEAAGNAYGHR